MWDKLLYDLLPILQCTVCHCNQLELVQGSLGIEMSIPLHTEHILCTKCGACYPITEDLIPVMWTPSLREHLIRQPENISNIGANIEIYNATSTDYQSYKRQY